MNVRFGSISVFSRQHQGQDRLALVTTRHHQPEQLGPGCRCLPIHGHHQRLKLDDRRTRLRCALCSHARQGQDIVEPAVSGLAGGFRCLCLPSKW